MRSILYIFLLTFIAGLLSTGCKNESNTIDVSDPDIPQDFSHFYISFHSDSSFQMNHILFPLEGHPAADTSYVDPDDFKWQKETWKLHNFDHFDADQFDVNRKITDSTLITEVITDKVSGFGIKRRFAKFNDDWFLIYYDAMNPAK